MERRTELRLALVMNGGVSLAVWMGGVVHEIALLVRASRAEARPPDGHPDQPVWDTWRRLCDRAGVTVTVDVVAGTSAGGLNGVLLATALARGARLDGLRDVWLRMAALKEAFLLRRDGTDATDSVLDGDYFAAQVRKVITGIRRAEDEDPAPSDVTLFVTATALGERHRRFTDAAGEPVVVPDHRQLYRFRRQPGQDYRPGSDEPFRSGPVDDFTDDGDRSATRRLSRAARASASFPGAFAPVRSRDPEGVVVPGGPVDLGPVCVLGGTDVHLMDGGVLDNAPFGPVLDEIARRPVDGSWKRVVAYVVPSGETKPVPDGAARPRRPDWVDTVLAGIGLKSEADVRDDLDRLTELQADADGSVRTVDRLVESLLHGPGSEVVPRFDAAVVLLPEYRRSQVAGSLRDVAALRAAAGRPSADLTPGDGDVAAACGWIPEDLDWSETSWSWGTAAAERTLRLLLRAVDRGGGAGREDAMRAISVAMARVRAVREAVEDGIRPSSAEDPAAVVRAVNRAVADARVPDVCGHLVAEGARAYADAAAGGEVREVVRRCLVVEVLTHALSSRRFERHTGFDFLRVGPDVGSPAVGDLVPEGGREPMAPGPWKLWGTQLGHFGAFGREEWRRQDWVWGRLDAASHLVRAVGLAGTAQYDMLGELHRDVLAAEARPADELRKSTAALAGLTARSVIRMFWNGPGGPGVVDDLADAVLRTVRSVGNHPTVTRNGRVLSSLFGRTVPPELRDEPREWVARLIDARLRDGVRGRFERWMDREDDPASR